MKGFIVYKNSIITQSSDIFPSLIDLIEKIKELNGNFSILIEQNRKNIAVTDRFGSYPIFWYRNERNANVFFAQDLSAFKNFAIDKASIVSLLVLQKIIGYHTIFKGVKTVPSGTILIIDKSSKEVKKINYYPIKYKNIKISFKEAANRLAVLFRKAFEKYSLDKKEDKFGLLLSGGLDSRLVGASAPFPLKCITIGDFFNNEAQVASSVAKAKKSLFFFLRREPQHYFNILEESVNESLGFNVFVHGHFFNFSSIRDKCDIEVLFHGHAIDYLFGGMYLPTKSFRIFNKNTYIQRLEKIDSKKLPYIFLEKIKYRLKSLNGFCLLKKNLRDMYKEILIERINSIIDQISKNVRNEYDIWDYLNIYQIFRHYTNLNLISIRSICEERTVALENGLFELYLSLPHEYKLNSKLIIEAIGILNRDLLKIKNANTNFRPISNPFYLLLFQILQKTRKSLGFKYVSPPRSLDRSWPERKRIIGESKHLQSLAKNIYESKYLDGLGIFDMELIKKLVIEHFNEKKDYSDVIVTLITIHKLLECLYE